MLLTEAISFLTIKVRIFFLTKGVYADVLTAKLTSKGQITIPKKVRDKLGVQAGEGIGFEEKDGVFYIKKFMKKSPFDKWVGKLKGRKSRKTDDVIRDIRGQ